MTERPSLGASLALLGSVIMSVAGTGTLSNALTAPRVTDVLAYTIELTAGIVVAACAILSLVYPREHKVLGYVIATFSLLSLFGVTGALCFGSMLGVLGAAVLLVWSPGGLLICPNCGAQMIAAAGVCPRCGRSIPYRAIRGSPEAFSTALAALFFVHVATALAAIGPYPLRKFPPLELLPGVIAEAGLLVGAVMAYRKPEEYLGWGTLLIFASLVAVAGPYYGFLLGPVLGIIAGVTAIRGKGG